MDKPMFIGPCRHGFTGKLLVLVAALALAACGGSDEKQAPPVAVEGDDAAQGQGQRIVLDAPQSASDPRRIRLTWQGPPGAKVFTVWVQRAADLPFEPVAATFGASSAEFGRGAAWRLDFPTARVQVQACNPAGQHCVASNAQPLLAVLLAATARITPPAEFPGATPFPDEMVLSGDGRTLALGTSQDKSSDRSQIGVGSVWMYQRAADSHWSPEARVNRFQVPTALGPAISISRDGTTLAVGADTDGGSAGGVNAPERGGFFIDPPTPGALSGAVYVFLRDAQQQWQLQAFIKAASPVTGERMGGNVALSGDGNRLAVTSAFRVYLFERDGSTWRQTRIVERRTDSDVFVALTMSADGGTFATTALESPAAGGRIHKVLVYRHCPCGDGWRLAADLRSAKPVVTTGGRFDDKFGTGGNTFDRPLSLSANGKTLAVGAPRDHGGIGDLNQGVFDPPAQGSIYVFELDSDDVWRVRANLRARSAPDWDAIGRTVELDADGKVLVTKACGYAANDPGMRRNHAADATVGATGPACDETPLSHLIGGAAYVFERDGVGGWSHAAAAIPAPGEETFFDSTSIAFSADAQTLAISVASRTSGVPPRRVVVY